MIEIQKEIYQVDSFPILCVDQVSIVKKNDTFFILNLIDSQLNYFNINGNGLRNFKILIGCEIINLKNKYSYFFFKESLETSFIYKYILNYFRLDLLILSNREENLKEFGYLIEKYTMEEHDISNFQDIRNLILSNFFFMHNYNLKVTKKVVVLINRQKSILFIFINI